MSRSQELLSLVVPVRNEEEQLGETYTVLHAILRSLDLDYEVILVDNGSHDATPQIAADLCARDPKWRYLRLSRDFGYQNSTTAGMLAARGDAIMVIDADLQDPPELIPEFIAKWREGYEVVYGIRQKRTGESRLRVIPTMIAHKFIVLMSDEIKLPLNAADYRLITRRVRDAFAQLSETTRYVRGLIHWVGFKQIGIPYVRRGRTKGRSTSSLFYLIDFMFNAVFNFSVRPLRWFSVFGAATLGLTALLALVYLVTSFVSNPPPGLTTMILLLLGNLGVMALGIGILGEYIGKIFSEVKRRPLWLVDYTLNFEEPLAATPLGSTLQRVDAQSAANAPSPHHARFPAVENEAAVRRGYEPGSRSTTR
jgi:dolichol-phosphate mannosyltransferase